ncbi:MAG: hypothetical protein DRZ76_02145 [Candidatus Nealsonbacteria bacterium]|mgnify:CR=1 FL=1|nr:MAG: hypothetical protein DRZ76_02145 [Candidatus Nealsonbacteria bacterium]
MLNFQCRIKVYNHKGERINRSRCVFPPEEKKIYTIKDMALREIRACKDLEIKEIKYICPICNREFNKRHGLITHITKAHPEEKYKLKGKK